MEPESIPSATSSDAAAPASDFDHCEEIDRCVRSVQQGNQAAFRQIVERMLPVVRPYVAARSLPGVDVDEIVQQSFVEAYKSIGEYRPGTSFKAWLIAIARYQTMMENTRLRRQADYHSRYIPVAIAEQVEKQLKSGDFEDERLRHLRDCMGQLKRSSRELIRLRYADDRSMEEIGKAMQRSAGAIRKELCLIRKRLHECIGQKILLDYSADVPSTNGGTE